MCHAEADDSLMIPRRGIAALPARYCGVLVMSRFVCRLAEIVGVALMQSGRLGIQKSQDVLKSVSFA